MDKEERQAKAAYEEGMRSYAEMTPLNPELEEIARAHETRWDDLEPRLREHWRRIVRAAVMA